ncbi:MAG: bifunctional DNA primase/polymerase [Pseudomonadota bacterium]
MDTNVSDAKDASDQEKRATRRGASTKRVESVFDRIDRKKNPYAKDKYKEDFKRESFRIPVEFRQQATEALAAVAPIETIPHHNQGTLAMALACAACGIPVVDSHALDSRGKSTGANGDCKNPRGKAWGEEASTDPDKIISRWTGDGHYPASDDGERYRYADITKVRNVSAVTGNGFFIWDLDGESGANSHEELIGEHGELPPTPVTISGSGGRHFYFRCNRTINNTASAVAPGIDVRGVGGQGLLPLSIHKSGNIYVWAKGCAPWEL